VDQAVSIKAVAHVFQIQDERLEPQDKFILLAYVDHSDSDGRSIYPAVATVASKTGYSERTVQRRTRRLESLGLLIADGYVHLSGSRGRGMNRWRYNWEWQPEAERVSECHHNPERVTPEEERVTAVAEKGDVTVSPESSLTVSKSSYMPETKMTEWLFQEITREVSEYNENNTRKRRGAKKFKTLRQKRKLETAETRLGVEEFKKAADHYLTKGVWAIGDLTNSIAAWNTNNRASPRAPARDIGADTDAIMLAMTQHGSRWTPRFDDAYLQRVVNNLSWPRIGEVYEGEAKRMVKDAWFKVKQNG